MQEIRRGNSEFAVDRALLYATVSFDFNLPYWATHLMDIFEQRIWKGASPRFLYLTNNETDVLAANALYRGFMEYMLAIAPGNAHAVDLALHYLEGTRGFEANPTRAREMLRESTAGLARFYLGVMSQNEDLGGEDVEAAKMNFDAACRITAGM